MRNVNPGYPDARRTHNCVDCSIATDATLAGNPASALPINSTKGVPLTVLEKQHGAKFSGVSSPETIKQKGTNLFLADSRVAVSAHDFSVVSFGVR
ncbi:toxin glutamine deamidase domain-containing protein [Pseudomonas sp. ICMP 8385]|uniref:toxin glutamine deamidase domain-containing protein n=1 Tax=Pseudomonas TaxID=286 RepID=UPI0011460A32|nr:hypothetical protein [Pseudomonas gessardii]NNA70109.1 hypothetical protein [Pseudomonas gessardii]